MAEPDRDVQIIYLGATMVDVAGCRLLRGGKDTPLTKLELRLLLYLWNREGQPVERRILFERVWGYSDKVRSRALDSAVRRLRVKLETRPNHPEYLLTERGVGYRLRRSEEPSCLRPQDPGTVQHLSRLDAGELLLDALAGLDRLADDHAIGGAVLSLRVSRLQGRRQDALRLTRALSRTSIPVALEVWWRSEAVWSLDPGAQEAETKTLIGLAETCENPAVLCRALASRRKGSLAASRLARALSIAESAELVGLIPHLQASNAYFLNRRDPLVAHRLYLLAIAGARRIRDPVLEGRIDLKYVTFLITQGAHVEACRRLRAMLASSESSIPLRYSAWAMLGVLEYESFRPIAARAAMHQSLCLARQMNRSDLVLIVRLNLLYLKLELKQSVSVDEAEACVREAAGLDLPAVYALTLYVLGKAWASIGRLDLGLLHLGRAIQAHESVGFGGNMQVLLAEQATLRLLASDGRDGREALERAIEYWMATPGRDATEIRFLEVWNRFFDDRVDFEERAEMLLARRRSAERVSPST